MRAPAQSLLVIDDDTSCRQRLSRQLDEAGYDVHLARDGLNGLEVTRSLRPDFVICDWTAPRLDGVEYSRNVKADPGLRNTYVVLLTDRANIEERVRGLDAGADDVIVKPFDPQELLARVRAGLRIRRLQQEAAAGLRREALIELASTYGERINDPLTALLGHMELVLKYIQMGNRERMLHHVHEAGESAYRIAEVARSLGSLTQRGNPASELSGPVSGPATAAGYSRRT